MDIPQTFLDELRIEFQDRLRARFSGKQQAIVIEQRVGRNILPSLPRKMYELERQQSLAEGYIPIMTISAGQSVRCPECSAKLQVPKLETKQISCLQCKIRGRATKVIAGYYPLNAQLIHHLKTIDPMRNMENDDVKRMTEYNEKISDQQQKQLYDDADAYASDNLSKLMGILQTGYSQTKVKEGTEVKGF